MSQKKNRKGARQPRRVSVRAVRRSEPDIRRLSRALVAYALQQAADEAAAQQTSAAPSIDLTSSADHDTLDPRAADD